jgi:hypothetical protein
MLWRRSAIGAPRVTGFAAQPRYDRFFSALRSPGGKPCFEMFHVEHNKNILGATKSSPSAPNFHSLGGAAARQPKIKAIVAFLG